MSLYETFSGEFLACFSILSMLATSTMVPFLAPLLKAGCTFERAVPELAFLEIVLSILLNTVGSTCLLVWTSALLAQLALRRRADREGHETSPADARLPLAHVLWPSYPRGHLHGWLHR